MKIDGDYLIFSTGTRAYAHNGVIGLSGPYPGEVWHLLEGYDGSFEPDEETHEVGFSKEEKIELADYMIELWGRFKKSTK